jgi:hypothetical protein
MMSSVKDAMIDKKSSFTAINYHQLGGGSELRGDCETTCRSSNVQGTCQKYMSVYKWCGDENNDDGGRNWLDVAKARGDYYNCKHCAPGYSDPLPAVSAYVPPASPAHVPPAYPAYVPPASQAYVPPAYPAYVPPAYPAYVPPAYPAYVPPASPEYVPPASPAYVPPRYVQAPAKAPYVQPVPQYQTIGNNPINGSCTSTSPLTQAWSGFGVGTELTMDVCLGKCISQQGITANNPGGLGCSAVSFVPKIGNRGSCTMHFGLQGSNYSCTNN